jgi:serine/threonine protein kinase/tetratricopeptide (TPR) repeat protein
LGILSELFDALKAALADRYTLERELGRGGMATVYLAGDVKHRRKVAIKVLHPEIGAAIGPERFLREIEIAASLQHPHILPLYDSGDAAGNLYYVMPFVEGESLRDRLKRERQLPQEDVIKITSEVASALGYAHSRDIVHRDIKPENIMLSGGSAIVADFGIARAASAMEQQQLTQTGTVVGTPLYMSPEQSMGSDIDGRSDEYSLACVVYEMLVGEPPFTGPNVQAIIARHSMQAVSPPSIIRLSIPETMERALLKALEKTPADRYPTVIMFAEAFAAPSTVSAAMRRQSTTAVPTASRPSVTLQLPVPSWRHLARWAIPGLLVLIVAGWGAHRLIAPKNRADGSNGVAAEADPRRIAVLYFDVRSFDAGTTSADLGYLADGLTEALIHELSQVQKLQVVSSNGVRLYKNTKVSPDSIGRALKVGTLVEGTVAQSGQRLRVSVSLVNAATGEEVGSTTLEQPRADLFVLQDTLAKAVSIALRQRLGEEIQVQETRAGTKNVAAWELTQQGQEIAKSIDALLAVGDTTAAGKALSRADSVLAEAQTLDRSWVTPLVARGWLSFKALSLVGTFDKGYYEKHLRQALDFAAQALRLRPEYADALTLRGTMRSWLSTLNLASDLGDANSLAASAEQDLSAAVAADPNQAPAWAELSFLLMHNSKTSEAKLAALRAYEADPYLSNSDKVLWRLFQSSIDLDDGVEAKRWCQEGKRRFPKEPRFIECQLWLFAMRGQRPDVKSAWQLLDTNVALYPPNERDYRRRRGAFIVAMALARAGIPDSARAVALRARADATIDPAREFLYIEAILRAMLGDRDEALRLLTTYLATNPQDRVSLAKDDTWWWTGLRDDPRFKKLVGLAS